jgi:membrane protease YdiL (CAAX protease family)
LSDLLVPLLIVLSVDILIMGLQTGRAQDRISRYLTEVGYALIILLIQLVSVVLVLIGFGISLPLFGLTFKELPPNILIGVGLGVISIPIQYYWLNLRLYFSKEFLRMFPRFETKILLRKTANQVILTPIVEELFLRGALQSLLAGFVGIAAVPLVAIIFYFGHFVNPVTRHMYTERRTRLFLLYEALILSLLRFFTGSIVSCTIVHSVNNLPATLGNWMRSKKSQI